jgi:hypothetical protein
MGCDQYAIEGIVVQFSETDDNVGCLCTFPHNEGEVLTADRARSLAMLGAAVVAAHSERSHGMMLLPHDLPEWIVKGLKRLLPDEEG